MGAMKKMVAQDSNNNQITIMVVAYAQGLAPAVSISECNSILTRNDIWIEDMALHVIPICVLNEAEMEELWLFLQKEQSRTM